MMAVTYLFAVSVPSMYNIREISTSSAVFGSKILEGKMLWREAGALVLYYHLWYLEVATKKNDNYTIIQHVDYSQSTCYRV